MEAFLLREIEFPKVRFGRSNRSRKNLGLNADFCAAMLTLCTLSKHFYLTFVLNSSS